jgi:hypothetical protein
MLDLRARAALPASIKIAAVASSKRHRSAADVLNWVKLRRTQCEQNRRPAESGHCLIQSACFKGGIFGPRGDKTRNTKARECRAIACQRWSPTCASSGDDEPRELTRSGNHCSHSHGPNCGPEEGPHGDHVDYLVDGRLHYPHGDHCDDHGPL